MIPGSSDTVAKATEKAIEFEGKLASQLKENKLMHSVLQNDRTIINDGKLLKEALNMGQSSLVPDAMFETLVSDYKLAEKLFGKGLLRLATGHSPDYLKQNLRIPEFRKKLRGDMDRINERLVNEGYLEKDGSITGFGIDLASVVLYVEELERLIPKGTLSGKLSKYPNPFGEKGEGIKFHRGLSYKDINVKGTLKMAARRLHKELIVEDLIAHRREARGTKHVVFLLDSSGSMRETKIDHAKRAGVALAYKAINDGNKIGLVVFSTSVLVAEKPSRDFTSILRKIARVSPRKETNLAEAIKTAIGLFPRGEHTKHIIALTDALPTFGNEPEQETLAQVSNARAAGITFSLVGIGLDSKGEELAKRMAELGNGRLYAVRQLEGLDRIVLMDYLALK